MKPYILICMNFFSVGSTVGLTIAFGLSLWLNKSIIVWMFLGFLILAGTGLWHIKEDLIDYAKYK